MHSNAGSVQSVSTTTTIIVHLSDLKHTSKLEVEAAEYVGRQIGSLMIACKQAELVTLKISSSAVVVVNLPCRLLGAHGAPRSLSPTTTIAAHPFSRHLVSTICLVVSTPIAFSTSAPHPHHFLTQQNTTPNHSTPFFSQTKQ
jgi:hypothetical protein